MGQSKDDDYDLELSHIAGHNVQSHSPLFTPPGDSLFLITGDVIQIYSTTTGQRIRQLTGATSNIISMELELKNKEILVACSEKGEVLRWKWSTGELKATLQLKVAEAIVSNFHLLNLYKDSEAPCAFVVFGRNYNKTKWSIYDTGTGQVHSTPCTLVLRPYPVTVAVDSKNFKYLVVAQCERIYFVNYKTWKWTGMTNPRKVRITCARTHPVEEAVATGDEEGRVFIWREFWDKNIVKTSLYHWHHTSVTSLSFSQSGTSFYSSAMEFVLVRWNVARPELRNFVPRLSSIVKHIAVNEANVQIAVCTADNAVHILGNDHKLKCNLQEFTYTIEDGTNQNKFPIGLKWNPRTSTMVLNGRTGHLQFYSAQTRSLLFNIDIVGQNQLSFERNKILYNTRVVKAAFNIDWMATGEVFYDEEHLPEVRLKFWKYDEKIQRYTLNTSIELPHEGGFKAIEFSNKYQMENLLCATLGEDNKIKIWSLEDSDNIYKKGKIWYCIAQTKYKDEMTESIHFSQDGTLLAAGSGNTVCIYNASTLKLRAALSPAPGLDGNVAKTQIHLAEKDVNGSRNDCLEQREKILQKFKSIIQNRDDEILEQLKKTKRSNEKSKRIDTTKLQKHTTKQQKEQLFNTILELNELNLDQKILLYQKLGACGNVRRQFRNQAVNYVRSTVDSDAIQHRIQRLNSRLMKLNKRNKLKAKYRLCQYLNQQKLHDSEIRRQLISALNVLNLNETEKLNNNRDVEMTDESEVTRTPSIANASERNTTQIRHVQFAAGSSGHLVIACTDTRILVWNLLNLRLLNVLKLSVKHIAFDPDTNLIAAFTVHNNLFVFSPKIPVPVYFRANMPNLYGLTWLPRRNPRNRCLDVDWQSQSVLYFLSEKQELLCLGKPEDVETDNPPAVTFNEFASTQNLHISAFGAFSSKQSGDQEINKNKSSSGPLVVSNKGKGVVRTLIEMSTHVTPPMNLLCADFLKSLTQPAESHVEAAKAVNSHKSNQLNNGYGHDTDDSDVEQQQDGDEDEDVEHMDADDVEIVNGNSHEALHSHVTLSRGVFTKAEEIRKTILMKEEELKAQHRKKSKSIKGNHLNTESLLDNIMKLELQTKF